MAKEPERIADLIVFLKEEPLNKLLIDFVTSNSNDANYTFLVELHEDYFDNAAFHSS